MPEYSSVVLAHTIVRDRVDVSGWARDVERRAQAAIFQLGQETRDVARSLAPVNTGALRASIYVTRPGSAAAQAQGKLSRQSSAGYMTAARRAERLNPGRLEFITDNRHISPRTQRDLSPADHWDHLTRVKVTKTHRSPYKRFGTHTYTGFEDDFRSIMSMAESGRATFFVTVGAAAFYAGMVEYGTVRTRAHPFMTPAVEWARRQLPARLKAAIGREGAKKIVG